MSPARAGGFPLLTHRFSADDCDWIATSQRRSVSSPTGGRVCAPRRRPGRQAWHARAGARRPVAGAGRHVGARRARAAHGLDWVVQRLDLYHIEPSRFQRLYLIRGPFLQGAVSRRCATERKAFLSVTLDVDVDDLLHTNFWKCDF